MSMTSQQQQTISVQLHQRDDRLGLAAPMPGLEADDISVRIHGTEVTMHGTYRGSRHDQPEVLISEWTMGPYHRDITLPQAVDGELTNATYGNGVLVLSMPKLAQQAPQSAAQFQLEVTAGTRGQRIAHTGLDMHPTTAQERRHGSHQAHNGGSAEGASA